jgi:ABC-type nitrate/sulfonate/bicarbonate transport system substrate-binding protein
VAIEQGLLEEAFAADGIQVRSLRSSSSQKVRESHFDHNVADSFREGGSIPPIWTRARGAGTKLIATNWVDEYQAIIALPAAGIAGAGQLKGRRLGLPRRLNDEIDYWRAMCLRGYESALATAGITLKDVELVDLPIPEKYISDDAASASGTLWSGASRARRQQVDAFALIRHEVDAIYTAGAAGMQLCAFLGAWEVCNLGLHPDPMVRVNNQLPNVLTVSADLLDQRPDIVDRYLERLLAAAKWAKSHHADTVRIVANDVGAPEEWAIAAYKPDFTRHLAPNLAAQSLSALEAQKSFLHRHCFIDADFPLADWIDSGPLERLSKTLLS